LIFVHKIADIESMVRPFRKRVFRVYVKAQNIVYRNTTTSLLIIAVAITIVLKFKNDLIRHRDKIFFDSRQEDFYYRYYDYVYPSGNSWSK